MQRGSDGGHGRLRRSARHLLAAILRPNSRPALSEQAAHQPGSERALIVPALPQGVPRGPQQVACGLGDRLMRIAHLARPQGRSKT
jgi:hypothetical protein